MDELDLQGKKYISSKRAAEVTGYAKDYVGQLARGGKVPATRVGRAWYVELNAIKRHAGVEATEAVPAPENSGTALEAARDATSTLTPLYYLQSKGAVRNTLNTWEQVRYLHDEGDLLPAVKVRQVEATTVPIRVDQKKILQTMNMSPIRTSQPKKSPMDGVLIKEVKPVPEIKRAVRYQPTKLPALYVGAAAVFVIAAGIVAVGGLYTPREWLLTVDSTQTASVADFSVLLDYFSVLFADGVLLIADFLSLLLGSMAMFFEAGLSFFLSFF